MTFTFDETVSQLQSQLGIPYERARAIAEANAPAREAAQQPRSGSESAKPSTRGFRGRGGGKSPEKIEEEAIDDSAIARGAFVYRLSQARETNQTPGLPDRYLVWPDMAVWWEVKSATGVLSQPQARFAIQCTANGTPCGCGTQARCAGPVNI